jgi:hypothetical protein
MQTGQTAAANQNTAGALVLGGGVLAVVAGFLDWAKFVEEGAATTMLKGTDLNAGSAALGLGAVLIIFGIILLVRGKTTGGKGSSITAIVLAAFLLFAAAYSALAPGDAVAQFEASDLAESAGVSESQAKAFLQQGIDSGQFEVTTSIGAWVGTAGGVLALVGGIIGVATVKKIRGAAQPPAAAAPPAAAPPPTGTTPAP